MYVRVVRLKMKPGCLFSFREYYERRILPALAATPGCLIASLMRPASEDEGTECDSLTLWDSASHADAYVDSGLYDELLDGADPYLASATEWKTSLPLVGPEQRPPLQDPEVEAYPVQVASEASLSEPPPHFLRIVDMRVEPSAFPDLMRTYQAEVVPALLSSPGCRAAYLVEGPTGRSRAISATFWDDEASALRHQASGRLDELTAVLRPYLSGIYQWRLSLAAEGAPRTVTASDLDVRGYHVVTGRRLR